MISANGHRKMQVPYCVTRRTNDMRRWKQISACCLAAVMAAGPAGTAWAGSPEFARTAEEWAMLRDNVMEYGELAGLIHEYNVTVQNNQLEYNKTRQDGDVTSDEIAQAYRDAADEYWSQMDGEDPASDAAKRAAARAAEKSADNNVEDLTIYRMTYDQTEANLVAAAQTAMISYHQQQLQLQSAKDNRALLETVYNSAVVRLDARLATQVDVLTAEENLRNADTSIHKLEASIEETRQNLCVMLGWRYNDQPEIRDIPEVDMAKIEAIDLEADKQKALANNYTLNINKRKYDNAQSQSTKETLQKTISDNEQKIGADMIKNYQSVLQSKLAYDQAVAELNLESKNMESANQKIQLGLISNLDYQQQQNTFSGKQIAVQTAKLNLFQAVQTYENAVNGLASTGG